MDFTSIYVSAFYLVIITFTSIGYGDIRAEIDMDTEVLWAMIVMMIGMIFYGYMLGTFQKILSEMDQMDPKTESEDKLDMFILQLGQSRKAVHMEPCLIEAMKSYRQYEYRWNPMHLQNDSIF